MHELSVTENILEIATRHANQVHAQKITDIHIVIGQLASIIDDSVQFYWDIISEGTIGKGAQLHFKRIPAKLECLDCGHIYGIKEQMMPCPECKSHKIKIISGEEFWLDSIDVEA